MTSLHSFFLIISLGGNVCFLSSIFSSGTSKGPPKPWEDPMTYPAIKGYSIYDNNLFVNYTIGCGMRSYVWMTRPSYGDAIHPLEFSRTSVINVDEQSKVISIIFLIDSYWFVPCFPSWIRDCFFRQASRCFWFLFPKKHSPQTIQERTALTHSFPILMHPFSTLLKP